MRSPGCTRMAGTPATPSRLNARYVPALHVAEMILDGRSFEQRIGELTVTGFLFSMAKIFEDFVCVALREGMRAHGGRSTLQFRGHLDKAAQVVVCPDYVWSSGATRSTSPLRRKVQ